MRYFVLCLMMFVEVQAWAYPCPATFRQDPQAQETVQWLSRFGGQTDFPNCHIEITTCDPGELGPEQAPLAELYIVDAKGREAYLPISLVAEGTPKIETSIRLRERSLYYIKKDRFEEPEFGRTEAYRLEIRTEPKDLQVLRGLDLGTYSTNKKIHTPDGNQSRWYNCGEG